MIEVNIFVGQGFFLLKKIFSKLLFFSFFPRIIQPFATLIGRFTFRSLHRFGLLKRVIGKEHLDYMQENSLQMEALECIQVKSVGTAVLAPEGWDSERKRLLLKLFFKKLGRLLNAPYSVEC